MFTMTVQSIDKLCVYLFSFKDGCGDCNAGKESIACAAEMADLLQLLNAGHEINKGSAMVGLSCLCHFFCFQLGLVLCRQYRKCRKQCVTIYIE